MLRMDRALFCDHLPAAIGQRIGFLYRIPQHDLGTQLSGSTGIRMGCSGRIKMAIKRVIQRSDYAFRIDNRCKFSDLVRTDDLSL